ncbi:outer membrane beta-barrel protein [Coraliomargarita sinensis]|nr:outer membrane beta-barrel protein [Coraliomargarita sinensis]
MQYIRVAVLAACASTLSVSAQVDKTPDFAPFLLDKRVEREDYNFRLGPMLVDMVGSFGIEYNDNINTSEVAPIEDVILQPGISFGLKWQINEYNELDANLGLEYWHYLSESELNDFSNQIGLTPNTELSFRVLIKDITFRIYDRIQYSFDSADSVVVDPVTGNVIDSDPEAFTRFRNVLGIQTEWFIGETIFSAQLSREDIYSPEDIFEYVNRYEHKAALNVERALAANFTTGLGISYSTIDFDLAVNNDADTFTFGPWIDWKITEFIGLYAGVAYNDYDFETGALTDGTVFGDDSELEDYTWMVRLSHVANEVFNHQVEWYRAISVSNTANSNVLDGIRYSFAYNIMPRIRLDGAVGYEESESSGGLINDDFDRWIWGLSTEVLLGPQLTADIGYRYIDKESDAAFQSYEQNQFRIFLKYDF